MTTANDETTNGTKRDCWTRRCLCVPYPDEFLIAARIFSLLPLSISWTNHVTLGITLEGAFVLPLIWWWNPTKNGFLFTALLSLVASIGCFFVGIELLPPFGRIAGGGVATDPFDDDDDIVSHAVWGDHDTTSVVFHDDPLRCGEWTALRCETSGAGSIAALFCGVLWFLVTDCLFLLIRDSERLAKLEAQHPLAVGHGHRHHPSISTGAATIAESSTVGNDDDDDYSTSTTSWMSSDLEMLRGIKPVAL